MPNGQPPLTLKLGIKSQWVCDLCSRVIESDKDGMLEWDSYFIEDDKIVRENFRIVHGRWMQGCSKNRPTDKLADGHLHWYTGSDGLHKSLEMLKRPNLNIDEFLEITKRLHVDYYEEARQLFDIARENADFDYEEEHVPEEELIRLIRKYGN
ncbi:hypothetical protein MKX42_30760 [Paenibacillus sp. FSL R7-0204]|uniref:hypothetical protein n=1 Tax=Paenibacillus sp. FSL R7-0204 TaxID=2921675 RepID=UPI0030F72966